MAWIAFLCVGADVVSLWEILARISEHWMHQLQKTKGYPVIAVHKRSDCVVVGKGQTGCSDVHPPRHQTSSRHLFTSRKHPFFSIPHICTDRFLSTMWSIARFAFEIPNCFVYQLLDLCKKLSFVCFWILESETSDEKILICEYNNDVASR